MTATERMEALRAMLAAIPGIARAEYPPPLQAWNQFPVAVVYDYGDGPGIGTAVSYGMGQRTELQVLTVQVVVGKANNTPGELSAATAWADPVLAAFEASPSLGTAGEIERAVVLSHRNVRLNHSNQDHVSREFVVQLKHTTPVSFGNG